MTRRRLERALAYVLLVIIAIIGLAPFVVILIVSTKSRIEVLQVPPALDFNIDQIVKNYRDVLISARLPGLHRELHHRDDDQRGDRAGPGHAGGLRVLAHPVQAA